MINMKKLMSLDSIQAFNIKDHFDIMLEWLVERDVYLPSIDEMPAIGFVVYHDHIMTAMGFIRMVEGGYGQLDGLVTNPKQSPEIRSVSIDLLVSRLIYEAKEMELKSLIAFSKDKNTLLRSTTHGFVSQDDQHVIVLPLVKPAGE